MTPIVNTEQMPRELVLPLANCCALASEVWRLARYVDSIGNTSDAVALRYSLRQLSKVLEELKIAVIDLAGKPYDSGMVQEVLEVIDDPEMTVGQQLIAETISPTVTWDGIIAQPGQITLRRSPLPDPAASEVSA